MVERRQAEKTSFIFARETESTGSPITDRTQIVKRRYVVTAWNHDENSEKEQSDSLRAGRADVFGEDGFLWGDGDIEIEIPSESGFLDIIQGVLADPTPVSTAIPDKTLVASGTDLSDIVAADYFKDMADRNPEPDRPGQLRFQFSDENAGGQIIVRGVRKVGLASSDTLPMREVLKLSETAGETADVTLEKYFHRINKVEIKDKDGADFSTGTVEITSVPGGFETTLKTVNDEFPGWTMEPEVGGEPWVVTRGVPIGAEIAIGDTIRATIDILSNRVDKRRTIEGGDDEQFQSTAAQHPSEFPFVGRRFFSSYGKYLEINDEAVICDAAPISIAHNYDFAQGKIPGRFRRGTEPTARRNVTSSVQTKYESGTSEEDVFIRWDEKFRNNEPVSAKIVTYQWLGNGKQLAIIYELPYCEITDPVRVAATGAGSIPVTVALKAVPPPGETEGELRVTIVGDDQWA